MSIMHLYPFLYFSGYSGGLRCEYTPLATYTRADTKENHILAQAC